MDRHLSIQMIKDMSIALLSAAALLFTINLAVITATMDISIIHSLRIQILASAILLIISILLGTITISILIFGVEKVASVQNSKNIAGETSARLLSAFQFWSFFFGMAMMIWAIILRLF